MTWKLLNSVINKGRVSNDNCSFLVSNALTNDPVKIVNRFNEFFVNIGCDLAKNIPPSTKNIKDFLPSTSVSSLALLPTDEFEVTRLIMSLKNSSSPGLDEIPPSVVKFACSFIAAPLTKLINCSMHKWHFPK